MTTIREKARELTTAIRRRQEMVHHSHPQYALQNQGDLILILAAQLDLMLDEPETIISSPNPQSIQ